MIAHGKLKPFASTLTTSATNDVSGLLPVASRLAADDVDPIYTYDLNGNRVSMIDPTGLTTYTYDALNRLTSITNNKAQLTSFIYDALGRRTSLSHANGVVTNYNYDAASQLLKLVHQRSGTTINSFDYTYDRIGNRKSKADNTGTANYAYDVLNRLTQAVSPLPTNPLETFGYDSVGNRINSNQNGTSIFNQANQLLEDANFTYGYDRNGNQTGKIAKLGGALTQFEYDAENKLVRVASPNNTANYRYDALGRRVEKEVIAGTTTITRYLYDNEDILLELDAANNVMARYTHGPGIDEPLILEKGAASYFYHADALRSISDITNQFGTVVQRYTYSSFGKIEFQLDANLLQPYTYTSRELDVEAGLYHYRARTYDAAIGRFLQEDPARSSGGDNNFYSYVLNNPVGFVDPSGKVIQIVTPDTYVDLAFIAYDLYRILIDNLLGNCNNLDDNVLSLGGNLAGLAIPGITGVGAALRGGKAGRFVIGKLDDLKPSSLNAGESVLDWTNKSGSKSNWQENSSLLREAMSGGNPIRDASRDALTGELTKSSGFLNAERNLLNNHGWKFNPQTGYWNPPKMK